MSEDNYKLEASPEIESYEETRHISVEKGNHIAVFTLAFSAESIDNIIYPSRKSFEITKVEIGTKVIGIHIELDVSVVFLDLICNDTWITILEDEINDSFAGGCYEIIED